MSNPDVPSKIQALVTQGNGEAKVKEIKFDATKLEAHEVLIKVQTVGLNPTDWKSVNMTKRSNVVVGCDAAGDVVAVGSDYTSKFKVGDRVAGFTAGCSQDHNGAFAEYVRLDSVSLFRLPKEMSYEEGASLPIPHLTAVQSLYVRLGLPTPLQHAQSRASPGTILIWGGSSATGHHAIQLARLSGLQVIATASPQAFTELENIGASFVFDYKDEDVVNKIRKAAGEPGVQFVLDTISEKGTTEKAIDAVGPKGGKVVHLLPVGDEIRNRRADVQVIHTLLYQLIGPMWSFPFLPDDQPPVRSYLEHDWVHLTKGWRNGLGAGSLKPQRIRKLEPGFDGILAGMKQMREGSYGREKLVGFVRKQ
ncbi:chaperonin 10-like protein [Pterulicium gracile]|uniref:Chaperonin 10-like protein n=1 Tax=Pterulicium gracile TaxID=1884261 RepID=A0A5C3Q047_9AGAR|nr:chaperonin 10-like protein [Pterula gracilis]